MNKTMTTTELTAIQNMQYCNYLVLQIHTRPFLKERLQSPVSLHPSWVMFLSVCPLSANQEDITELFPQVSYPSLACGKSTPKHFCSSPLKPVSQRQFLQMQWFSILLLLLIFVLPSKYSKSLKDLAWTFRLWVFKHILSPFFLPLLPFPLYILFISFSRLLFPLRTQSLLPKQ